MAIELQNISKAYGTLTVLKDFNLLVPKGITCIMGPSGSGKTTIINILSGLVKPDSGKVIVPPNTKFSYVFPEDRLLLWENALDNLLFVSPKPKSKEANERAERLLCDVGLADSIYKNVREFSSGMRRRVAICRALFSDFDVLLLDEPFKGLDAAIKPSIINMVKANTLAQYVVVITHDRHEAEVLDGRVIEIV